MLAAWVLSLIFKLERHPACGEDCKRIAADIAEASTQAPIFNGPHAVEDTAALLVSMAWFESRFQERIDGDHHKSYGLWQIQAETAGVDKELLVHSKTAAPIALRLLRQSLTICSDRPEDDRLAWYAHGGDGCSDLGVTASQHRMRLSKHLRKTPMVAETSVRYE